MTSKKKINLNLILTACAILLAVITIILLCSPGMVYRGSFYDDDKLMADLAFGNRDKWVGFSFLIFLPYVLLLAGIVLNIVSILGKGGKILPIIATVCYVVGGVLFFLVEQTFSANVPAYEGNKELIEFNHRWIRDDYDIGLGAIFSGVLSIFSAGLTLATLFIKKK